MKINERIFKKVTGKIVTIEELERLFEQNGYRSVENDDEGDGVLKYTNGKSQLWAYYENCDDGLKVTSVTLSTKKKGRTTVHAFKNPEDIKKLLDYFWNNQKYDEYFISLLGMLLARRIGDTLSLKWSDFFYENGRKKSVLNTLVEQKTDKIVDIHLSETVWTYVEKFCSAKNINPMEHFNEFIFNTELKRNARTEKELDEAIKKQAACFRYEFKKAAEFIGVPDVSTHSLRKTYGYIAYSLNRYDPDCLDVLQSTLGHSDREITKRYIDVIDEKARKMFSDVSEFVEKIDHGEDCTINNHSVVAFKAEDFRGLVIDTIRQCKDGNGRTDIEILAEILEKSEKLYLH